MEDVFGSQFFAWFSAAAIVTVVSIAVNSFWERRKLNRAERSAAYAAFLDAWSRRQRAFQQRDSAKKRGDGAAEKEAGERVDAVREELWYAYCRVQVLAPQAVVKAAFDSVKVSDRRNHAFKNPVKNAPVGQDEQATTIASFVDSARGDMGLKALDLAALRGVPTPSGDS